MTVRIGETLTLHDIVDAAHRRREVTLGAVADRMAAAVGVIERAVQGDDVVYGVTTGFGAMASTRIPADVAAEAQVALLRSHAAGVGPSLPAPLVRAMLVLRAHTLSQGHSGVRPVIVERLVEMARRDLLPVVPAQGSVGASGDLAPFAHLALPVIGEGFVSRAGDVMPAAEALEAEGLDPLVLQPKEGLSLLNGTEGMLSFLALGWDAAEELAVVADIAAAMSVDGLMGSARPFDERIHRLRPHPGQARSAETIRGLLEGSEIEASHRDDFGHAVQDAYSLRCAPQVHGAVRDTIDHVATVGSREVGSVVDNPLVFPDDGDVVSGGNFHGQPLAFALDFLTIAMTELGSISERRTDRILDPARSAGLPPFLASNPGLNSGYMLAQYTAAALVAENRVMAHPASVDSIPTSGLQEDHVSMGWGAGRKAHSVIENTTRVLAVELLCAAAAVEHRGLEPGRGVRAALDAVRALVPPPGRDRPPAPEIEGLASAVSDGSIRAAVEEVVGPLR